MLSSLLLAATFQIGPFYEQRPDYFALRPIVSHEAEVTDVLWPVFTSHRDWWRFCYIVNYQNHGAKDGYQFSLLPIWFNGEDKDYIKRYKEYSYLTGKAINIISGDKIRPATVIDINDDCHLLVKNENDEIEEISSGDVSVRLL